MPYDPTSMNSIEIVEYRPEWTDEFAAIADQLRQLVGDSATRIDHIGSTSIPGLAAKDIIDIQISVEQLDNETIGTTLSDIGYVLVGPLQDSLIGYSDTSKELEKVFLREPKGQRRTNIHVREEGRINQVYALLFRDFLSTDTNLRAAYQVIKRALSEQFPDNAEAYYAIKDPYMDSIFWAAKKWATATGWKPDVRFS